MKEKGYYYNKAKEYTDEYINIECDIIDRSFEDLDHFAEFLIDTIDVEFTDIENDDECEKDLDQHRIEIYDYILTECKETIDKAIRVRQLFEVIAEDKVVMNIFNNNIWDLLEELEEATPEALDAYERLFLTPDEVEAYKKIYHIG